MQFGKTALYYASWKKCADVASLLVQDLDDDSICNEVCTEKYVLCGSVCMNTVLCRLCKAQCVCVCVCVCVCACALPNNY